MTILIRFPTGLYDLPKNPGDSGNITFLVSTTTPPRTNLTFPKIPVGLVDRGRNKLLPISQIELRAFVGDLVYSISSAKRQQVGNNARQYEIGQILEFEDNQTKTVEPMLVTETTETQHNTNLLDYNSLGLDQADQDAIAASSLQVYSGLTIKLNMIKQQRADTEMMIATQQKLVNEAGRAIAALQTVIQQQPNQDIQLVIDKLAAKQASATAVMDQAIADANALAEAADVTVAELRAVAVVVK